MLLEKTLTLEQVRISFSQCINGPGEARVAGPSWPGCWLSEKGQSHLCVPSKILVLALGILQLQQL